MGFATEQKGSGVHDRFLLVRKANNLTQSEYAARLGIALRAEQTYERGDRSIPSTVLLATGKQFGIDIHWLLEGGADHPIKRGAGGYPDQLTLKRALKIVLDAQQKAGRTLNSDDFVDLTCAAYQYLATPDHEAPEVKLLAKAIEFSHRANEGKEPE